MKNYLLLILMGLLGVSGGAYYQPQISSYLVSGANAMAKWSEYREFRISGNIILTEGEVLALLPNTTRASWWLTFKTEAAQGLLRSPLIASAQVSNCGKYSPKCFEISIVERFARLVAIVDKKAWLISSDGVFLAPYSNKVLSKFNLSDDPPLVSGLTLDSQSPDILKNRLSYVSSALETIEREVDYQVSTIDLQENGEIYVSFNRLAAQVIFENSYDKKELLIKECQRLRQLIKEFSGREQEIKKIDLAYNKLAVVELHE